MAIYGIQYPNLHKEKKSRTGKFYCITYAAQNSDVLLYGYLMKIQENLKIHVKREQSIVN